jgi:hypothetical protein
MIPPLKQLDSQLRMELHQAYVQAIRDNNAARAALVAEVGEERTKIIEAEVRREYMAALKPELIRAGINPAEYEGRLFGE